VDEVAMDAVTGLSGSGPAYIYYVAEALLAAGAAVGLPEETSRELLLQTLYGAARMLRETGKGPAELRRQVTSPNGTTMAGIAILDEREVHQAFLHAVERATARAREMGEALAE
jgi:pyrroline-5-carboxylate reductase